MNLESVSRDVAGDRVQIECWQNALQEFWRVLAVLCQSTHKSINTEMAFLCDRIRNTILYSCNCDKMVVVVLCSSLWVRACLVQPLLHWREFACLFRPSNLVFYLRLQDVYLDADWPDGSWDKAAGEKAHATGLITNFFSIEDFSALYIMWHRICQFTLVS